MSDLTDELGGLLAPWMVRQRWFAAKGRTTASVRIVDSLPVLPAGPAGVAADVHIVRVDDAVYCVPLSLHRAPLTQLADALVGVLQTPSGRCWVYDGPHDPAFVEALLDLIADQASLASSDGIGRAHGIRQEGAPHARLGGRPRVLSGEQSNTSVIVEHAGQAGGVILKLFRSLHAGQNPDVVVQSALAAVGCERVPAPVGWVEGTWPDDDGSPVGGHLAYVCEFIAGSQDAFREACLALDSGESFATAARGLGAATAEVHSALARALPTRPASPEALKGLADALAERIDWAVGSAPILRPHAETARAAVEEIRRVPDAPPLQRIHGDYHLGQVLHSARRGWVLLDFEGEPLRPLSERHEPDLPLRDVAGMLRSFDYAARHTTADLDTEHPRVEAAQAWAAQARAAFLAGYAAAGGVDPRRHAVLMHPLELDKAFYEVVYETRNRPTWVGVPLLAVERLAPAVRAPAVRAPTGRAPTSSDTRTPQPAAPTPQEEPVSDRKPAKASGPRPVDAETLARVATGSHHDPHSVLGAHPHGGAVTIRTLRPFAAAVTAQLPNGDLVPLTHEWDGIWTGVLPGTDVTDYRLQVTYDGAGTTTVDDPYRYLPTLGDVDLHLIGEGRHERLWDVLGAHVRHYPGAMGDVTGTSFSVWAPNARAVRVVADFNHWVGREHGMRSLGSSGVWELFIPGVRAGTRYKFEILGRDGHWRQKADPMAFGTEVPPSTASVVVESDYTWGDGDWMAERARTSPHSRPMSVYEVHLGSWRQGLSYRQLADQLVGYVKDLGFTHIELMPVAEHPFGGSWGYQVTSYYAPTSRFGSPDEFRLFVDSMHQAGIGVIMDWVPAHFPKDEWALARFDGEALYEYGDPRKGDHPEWGTHVFDFGRIEVRNFLVANALYWLEEYHIDGLRVDAVASMLYLDYSREGGEWVPNMYGGRENLEAVSFLQEMNATAYKRVPGIVTIAEESTDWPGVTRPTHVGGLGFGMKWNMGWMHDSLLYMSKDPVHRQYHHHQMTFSMMYAFTENFVLPISHDEVVHGKGSLLRKMPGDRWQQLSNVRAYLAFMWAHPGKQLIFMGAELGQEAEWSESRSLDWWLEETPWHAGLQQLVRDLNARYREHPALWTLDSEPAGFEWIDANDTAHNCFSFLRKAPDGSLLACAANFSGGPLEDYRIGLPHTGPWVEVLNTDAEIYGGSGVGNLGEVIADDVPWHGRPASAPLRVPPLGAVWLAPR